MSNSINNTRAMVEAALMSVLVFIMLLIVALVPGLGQLGAFVLPVPITIVYLRHNKKFALSTIIVSTILIAIFYNPIMAVASAAYYGFIGLVLGYAIKNKKGFAKTFGLSVVANLIGFVINSVLYIYAFMGMTINDVLQSFIDSLKLSADVYEKMGIVNDQNQQVIDTLKAIDIKMLYTMLPASIILAALLSAYLNYIISKNILNKLKFHMEPIPEFTRWYMDNRIGAVLIIISCIGIMVSSKFTEVGQQILTSGYLILNMLLTLQGISIIAYFLKMKLKLKKGFIIFICIFLVLSQLNTFIFALGLVDLIMDIRGIDPNSLGNAIRNKLKQKTQK